MVVVETVKIASNDTPMGYIIINKSDFDPNQHVLYQEPAEGAEAPTVRPRKAAKSE